MYKNLLLAALMVITIFLGLTFLFATKDDISFGPSNNLFSDILNPLEYGINNDYKEFITTIIKDLGKSNPKLSKIDIKLSIGPYFLRTNTVGLIMKTGINEYYILLDDVFCKSLSSEEIKALIGHEMGHLSQMSADLIAPDSLSRTYIEMQADIFSTNYVDVSTAMSLLKKTFNYNPVFDLRMANLSKFENKK